MAKNKLTSLSDLKPASYNPREIGLEELKALANSLGHFGDLSGITWNSRTGNIVCGHQRMAALKAKFGAKLVLENGQNGDSVVNTPDGEAFRVRVVDWPLEKEKAANIAANSPTTMGHFTEELQSVLDEIMAETPEYFDDLRMAELQIKKMAEEVSNSVGSPAGLEPAETAAGENMQVIFFAANKQEWEWMSEKLQFENADHNYNKDVGLALPASWLIEHWPSK
jgi:hypothetical protein